jgi:hypothetical protein
MTLLINLDVLKAACVEVDSFGVIEVNVETLVSACSSWKVLDEAQVTSYQK